MASFKLVTISEAVPSLDNGFSQKKLPNVKELIVVTDWRGDLLRKNVKMKVSKLLY